MEKQSVIHLYSENLAFHDPIGQQRFEAEQLMYENYNYLLFWKKKFLIYFIILYLLPEEQPAQRLQVPAQEPLQEPQLGLANTTEITKRRETQI